MSAPSQSANVGTVRSGWNTTIYIAIVGAISRYTELDIDIEDPFVVAVLGGVFAMFYRLSRVVADRWTWVGYVLFGSPRTPSYQAQPPAPAPLPPPPGG